MSPVLVRLLRRLALGALGLTLLLLTVPRLLTAFGLLGPSVEEVVQKAASSVEAARSYGADDQLPPFGAALRKLAAARALADQRQGREARQAAARANALAVESQRLALSRREEEKRQAAAVVAEVDRLLNACEEAYGEVTPGMDKKQVSLLLSVMKETRRTGAALVLAYDQGDYRKVLQDEKATRDALVAARERLRAGRT